MESRPKRIALVRLSALGDIINSAVVLQFIRKHLPDARIEWIVEEAFAPVLRPHPDLDAVHTVPLKRIKREKSLALLKETVRELRALGPYDRIVDLQGLLKSAVTARLLGRNVHGFDAASAREGLAARFYATRSTIPYETNVIRRNCDLVGEALGFRITDEALLDKVPALFVGERLPELPPRYIAVVVGASWPSKRYPARQLSTLCDLLPLPAVLVWGNDAEKAEARKIAETSSNATVGPPTTLPGLRDLIGHADLTIGGDTGPTHLAWALNRPSVVLFGPTTPRMMFETPVNVAIESDSTVDIGRIDKSDMSIADILPETIAETARRLL
jgi:heptosyltransferase-1